MTRRVLGGLLFERDRHGARPTALGDLVLSRARALLPAVKDLQDEAVRLAGTGGSAQVCRIGAVSSPILGGINRYVVYSYSRVGDLYAGHKSSLTRTDDLRAGALKCPPSALGASSS